MVQDTSNCLSFTTDTWHTQIYSIALWRSTLKVIWKAEICKCWGFMISFLLLLSLLQNKMCCDQRLCDVLVNVIMSLNLKYNHNVKKEYTVNILLLIWCTLCF